MFGYIKPEKPECKIREYEYYRAVYCGLCRALGRCGGQCARLTLTYDFTFLALLHMALSGERPEFHKRRCIAHPIFKHAEAKPNASLDFSARASLLLTWGKLLDDIADEKGKKRLRAKLLKPIVRPMRRRAAKGYGELEERLNEGLSALSALEKDPPFSIDRPALLFGNMMSALLSYSFEGEKKRIAAALGMALGKWVYLIDALDDLSEDARLSRYNPFVLVYGREPLTAAALGQISFALDSALAEAKAALDLVEFPDSDMKALAENILCLGMPSEARSILKKKERPCDAGSL